ERGRVDGEELGTVAGVGAPRPAGRRSEGLRGEVEREEVQPGADLEAAVDEREAGAGRERVRQHRAVAGGAELGEQELDLVDRRRSPALECDVGDVGSTVPGRHPGDPAAGADGLRLHRRRAYALAGPGSGSRRAEIPGPGRWVCA